MTAIVSGGRYVAQRKAYPLPTSATTLTIGPTAGYIPLLRGESLALTYEGIYRTQPWVYAVVNKQVFGIARIPLHTYEVNADDARSRARGNTLDRLLRNPAPRVSGYDFKAQLAWSLLIHGNALYVKARTTEGAEPSELWHVPWRYVAPVTDERGILAYEIHTSAAETVLLDPTQVVHYRLTPDGTSPLEPLRRTLALEDATMTWQGTNLRNGVTPRGAFVTDQKIREEVIPRLRTELESLYAGPENAGRVGILDSGFRWQPMGMSAVDAALIDQRKLSREEVCAAYDVPPPLVGILDRATFSNIDTLHKALYVDTLGPKLVLIEDTTQVQLIDDEPAWDGFYVEFDTGELLRPDIEARMRAYQLGQQSATFTINERRKFENLPPIDDPVADTVLIPLNMKAVGIEEPEPEPQPVPPALMVEQPEDADPRDPAPTVESSEEDDE